MSEGISPDVIESISALSKRAEAVSVVHPEAEPDHVYLLVDRLSSDVKKLSAEPEPRDHLAGDLASLAAEATRIAEVAEDSNVVIWYSRGGVVAIDDKCRRDTVVLPIKHTPQFNTLLGLEKSKAKLDQKRFVLLLRVDLGECLAKTGNFLGLIRQLKFVAGKDTGGTVQHGKESISRSTIAEVSGAEAVPEEVTLRVRVFELADDKTSQDVKCAIELDGVTETLSIFPFPGELDRAVQDAERAIGEKLRAAATVPVIYGSPFSNGG